MTGRRSDLDGEPAGEVRREHRVAEDVDAARPARAGVERRREERAQPRDRAQRGHQAELDRGGDVAVEPPRVDLGGTGRPIRPAGRRAEADRRDGPRRLRARRRSPGRSGRSRPGVERPPDADGLIGVPLLDRGRPPRCRGRGRSISTALSVAVASVADAATGPEPWPCPSAASRRRGDPLRDRAARRAAAGSRSHGFATRTATATTASATTTRGARDRPPTDASNRIGPPFARRSRSGSSIIGGPRGTPSPLRRSAYCSPRYALRTISF